MGDDSFGEILRKEFPRAGFALFLPPCLKDPAPFFRRNLSKKIKFQRNSIMLSEQFSHSPGKVKDCKGRNAFVGEEQFPPAAEFFFGEINGTFDIFQRDPRTLPGPHFNTLDTCHGRVERRYCVPRLTGKNIPQFTAAPLGVGFSAAGKKHIGGVKNLFPGVDPFDHSLFNKHFVNGGV